MTGNVLFSTVIKALHDVDTPFPARFLDQFSDISPEQLAALKEAWPNISLQRKLNVLEDLEDLAEKDTLLCFDDLARSLLDDPDDPVRTLAIQLLWECDDLKLVPIYLKILNSDPSIPTAAAAASALSQFIMFGELGKIPPAALKQVEDNLIKSATSEKDPLIRRKAIESLGASSRPEVVSLINKALSEPGNDWTSSALFAIGRSNDQRWGKQVLSLLRHPDDEVRMDAIQAAGELNLEKARASLFWQLEDEEDEAIQHAILWSLSQIGGDGVREKLESLLDATTDPDEEDFLEEALDNLNLTNEMATFTLMELDGSIDPDGEEFDTDDFN